MTIGAPTYDRAVHSDFLIHWTGKDIDADLHPDWLESSHHSRTNEQVVERYLKRLRDILTFGLWMTDEGTKIFKVGSAEIEIPATLLVSMRFEMPM